MGFAKINIGLVTSRIKCCDLIEVCLYGRIGHGIDKHTQIIKRNGCQAVIYACCYTLTVDMVCHDGSFGFFLPDYKVVACSGRDRYHAELGGKV
ncbi:hypothetical protein ES708_20495 [subsurface metagenome]